MKVDGRKLSHAQLEAIRFMAVKAVQGSSYFNIPRGDPAFNPRLSTQI